MREDGMRGEVQSRPALCGALLANTGRHTFVLTGWLSCGPVVGSLEPGPSPPPTQRPLPQVFCAGHGDGCPDNPQRKGMLPSCCQPQGQSQRAVILPMAGPPMADGGPGIGPGRL